jgi:hypothetical protein
MTTSCRRGMTCERGWSTEPPLAHGAGRTWLALRHKDASARRIDRGTKETRSPVAITVHNRRGGAMQHTRACFPTMCRQGHTGAPSPKTQRNGTSRPAFCFTTAGSQPKSQQSGKVRRMLRVNYARPEQMPWHQRDFPPRELPERASSAAGSRSLALFVASYLVAMCMGILLLGYLTSPVRQHAGTAATIAK